MTALRGQVSTSLDLPELASIVATGAGVGESSHDEGGGCVRWVGAAAEVVFERVASGEYLVRGDGGSLAILRSSAWVVSSQLAAAGVKHRLEVYDDDHRRVHAYFHWEWPLASAWIGCLAADAGLAESVAAVMAAVGGKAKVKVFERFPIADPLAALVASVGAAYSTVVWLTRGDDGREVWVRREAAMLQAMSEDKVAVHVFTVADGAVARSRGELVCQASDVGAGLLLAQEALPGIDVSVRRLLVANDTFLIAGRGLLLAPDVALALLPGASPQHIEGEVRPPGRHAKVFSAQAAIPFLDPPRRDRVLGYALMLRDAGKDDVPIDSEVWLVGGREGL